MSAPKTKGAAFYEALNEAKMALVRELLDKTRERKFSEEEIATAIAYRRGVIEGLEMAENIF